MTDGEKISGKSIPTDPFPAERVCYIIEIPDTLQYRAALMGQIEWLADWRCWKHTESDYVDPPQLNRDIAGLFAQAIADGRFNDCMDCEQVAECILTDAGVQDAIAQAITNNINIQQALAQAYQPTNGANPMSSGARGESLAEPETCDANIWFGGVTQLVDSLNTNIEDFLQQLAEPGTLAERISLMISAIPGINELPVDEAFEFFNNFLESFRTEYEGEYTEAYRTQLRCDIFCMSQDSCTLTIDDLMQYFVNRLSWTMPEAFEDIINFLVTGIWDSTQICDAFHILHLGAMIFNNRFNDILGLQSIATMLRLGFNNPDSDWETLCDCPEVWEHTIDLTQPLPAICTIAKGTQTGSGIEAALEFVSAQGKWFNRVAVDFAFSPAATITSADWLYDLTKGTFDETTSGIVNGQIFLNGATNLGDDYREAMFETDGTNKHDVMTGSFTTTLTEMILQVSRASSPGGGTGLLKSVTFAGTGTEPDWSV